MSRRRWVRRLLVRCSTCGEANFTCDEWAAKLHPNQALPLVCWRRQHGDVPQPELCTKHLMTYKDGCVYCNDTPMVPIAR